MAGLTFKPRSFAHPPRYPTKLTLLAMTELLEKRRPRNWGSNHKLATAAAAIISAGATGCKEQGAASTPGGANSERAAITSAIVAPVFRHGEGLGATGCIVINPPAYLSEEEAFQLISDELRSYGITLTLKNTDIETILIKRRETEYGYDWMTEQNAVRTAITDAPLNVDGLDPQHKIAVEFISARDYQDFDGPWQDRGGGTAYNIETLCVARSVAEQISDQPAGLRVGVFYDPLMESKTEMDFARVNDHLNELFSGSDLTEEGAAEILENDEILQKWRNAWRDAHSLSKDEAKELLREQVEDFVGWLKGQGVM